MIGLSKFSAIKGERIELQIRSQPSSNETQIDVDVYDCGVQNPSLKYSVGTTPKRTPHGALAVDIETSHLAFGIYEIRFLRLSHAHEQESITDLDAIGGRDFPRVFFEVRGEQDKQRTSQEVNDEAISLELAATQKFMTPIDIRSDATAPASMYTVFVFIKDILMSTRIRLGQMELIPTNDAIGSRDTHEFVNRFFEKKSSLKIQFAYGGQLEAQFRQASPVCVVHFPTIVSNSLDVAREFCTARTNSLMLALSLARDTAGAIFDIVIVDRRTDDYFKYTTPPPYVGNLLTGQIAGESGETLEAYINSVSTDSLSSFLVELYKEARREPDPQYQYVRLWQIIELIADQKQFDQNEPITDFEGSLMMEDGVYRRSKGAVNTVFRLLKEAGFGTTESTWKNVNIWFAFRSAIAHYGSLNEIQRLSRPSVRTWAQIGVDEIRTNQGYDSYLTELRWTVRLLLMQRLSEKREIQAIDRN